MVLATAMGCCILWRSNAFTGHYQQWIREAASGTEVQIFNLVNYSSGSLTDLVRTIVQKFVPESKRKYGYVVTVNVQTMYINRCL